MTPESASSSSTRSALSASDESRYKRTLVSKNGSTALIGYQPIEFEILWQSAAEFPQAAQQLLRPRRLFDFERAFACGVQRDIVTLAKIESLDHRGRQPNCQAIAPFGNLHERTP